MSNWIDVMMQSSHNGKESTQRASVVVIGGGAAGMIAAARAAECGAKVTLIERTERLGKKVLITGQTRCNLTNAKDVDEFIDMYGPNGKFLRSAFHRWFRDDLLALLERYGVAVKIERGGRIFPASDNACDVVDALTRYVADRGVRVRNNVRVTGISVDGGRVVAVETDKGSIPTSSVILATGGASYPQTGSSGDGYEIAGALGHTIVKLRPALIPLIVRDVKLAKSMQGVALRNVRLTAFACAADEIDPALTPNDDCGRGITGKRPRPPIIESRMGEMMLTHFGIGGPITLQMSLAIVDALEHGPVSVSIDLKPALDVVQLRRRLQRDFDSHGKRAFRRILDELLPRKMIDPYLELTGISAEKCAHEIIAEERECLLGFLKSLRFNIVKPLPMSAAIVTAGGVSLKEIDPKTMESRLVPGLFFCGEVMDIDADTGGYNLQAAFSTGYVAGESSTLGTQGTAKDRGRAVECR